MKDQRPKKSLSLRVIVHFLLGDPVAAYEFFQVPAFPPGQGRLGTFGKIKIERMERKETLENFRKQGTGSQQIFRRDIRGGGKRHEGISFVAKKLFLRKIYGCLNFVNKQFLRRFAS
ncbi:MAG: hypothetical protein ACYC56_15140 [Candidatus Aquicultor sp.]